METVKLVLRFKLIDERGVKVRFAARIQIDGGGRLKIWDAPQATVETVDLGNVEFISIQKLASGSEQHSPDGATVAVL